MIAKVRLKLPAKPGLTSTTSVYLRPGKKEFNIELKATVSVHLKVKMEKIRTPLEQPGATF